MAFITNLKAGGKKLGDRLSELVGHADRLDMLGSRKGLTPMVEYRWWGRCRFDSEW